MNETTQIAVDTAIQTAEAITPVALASANPEVALVAKLAPVAIQALQSAMQLSEAGAMTPDQLASLFSAIGAGIKTTHDVWATNK